MQELLEAGVTQKQVEELTNKLRALTDSHISQQEFSLNDIVKKVAQLSHRINQYETGVCVHY